MGTIRQSINQTDVLTERTAGAERLRWLQQYSSGAVRLLIAIEALAEGEGGTTAPISHAALGKAAGICHRNTLTRVLREVSSELVVEEVSARRARYGLAWRADRSKSDHYLLETADAPDGVIVQKVITNSGEAVDRSKSDHYSPETKDDGNVQKVITNSGQEADRSKSDQYGPEADDETAGENVQRVITNSGERADRSKSDHYRPEQPGENVQKVSTNREEAPIDSTRDSGRDSERMNDLINTTDLESFIQSSTLSVQPRGSGAGEAGVDYEPEGTALGHWQRRRTRELLRLAGLDPDGLDLTAHPLDWYRQAAIFRLLRTAAGEQGLAPDLAAALAVGRPVLLLERDYDYWCYQVEQGVKFRNGKTGKTTAPGLEWLVAQMQSGKYGIGHGYDPRWRWPELSLCPECGAEHENGQGYSCDACQPPEPELVPEPAFALDTAPEAKADIPEDVLLTWRAALGALEIQLGKREAGQYERAAPAGYANGRLTLRAVSESHARWLTERRYRLLHTLHQYQLGERAIESICTVVA